MFHERNSRRVIPRHGTVKINVSIASGRGLSQAVSIRASFALKRGGGEKSLLARARHAQSTSVRTTGRVHRAFLACCALGSPPRPRQGFNGVCLIGVRECMCARRTDARGYARASPRRGLFANVRQKGGSSPFSPATSPKRDVYIQRLWHVSRKRWSPRFAATRKSRAHCTRNTAIAVEVIL